MSMYISSSLFSTLLLSFMHMNRMWDQGPLSSDMAGHTGLPLSQPPLSPQIHLQVWSLNVGVGVCVGGCIFPFFSPFI